MKIAWKFLAAAVIALAVAACSNPRNYEIANLSDEQKAELGKSLSAEEGQKLAGWVMRHSLTDTDIPPGTTVAQALADQEKWQAEQKAKEAEATALAERLEKERKERQAEFSKLVSVAVLGKRNVDGDYGQQAAVFDVGFENKGTKGIEGIKGILHVTDIFGDSITTINWSYDDGVPAGETRVERGSGVDINKFIDRDMKLWNTDFSKMKTKFEVLTVVFEDGTSISAPE